MEPNPLTFYDESFVANESVRAKLRVEDDEYDIFLPSTSGTRETERRADEAFNTVQKLEAIREMDLFNLRDGGEIPEKIPRFSYAVDSTTLYNIREEGRNMDENRISEEPSEVPEEPEDTDLKRRRRTAARRFLVYLSIGVAAVLIWQYRREILDGLKKVEEWMRDIFGNRVQLLQVGGDDASSTSDVSSSSVSDVESLTSLDSESVRVPLLLTSTVPQSIVETLTVGAPKPIKDSTLNYIAACCRYFKVDLDVLKKFLSCKPFDGEPVNVAEGSTLHALNAVQETKGIQDALANLPNQVDLTSLDCGAIDLSDIHRRMEILTDSQISDLLFMER